MPVSQWKLRVLSIAVAASFLLGTFAQAEPIDYTRDVKPLLHRCYACHGALRQQSGLRLDTAAFMRQGGDNGPALAPGDPAASLLLDAIGPAERTSAMPPEGTAARLTPAEVATIRQWIEAGAVAPDEPAPDDPRQHWAFQPPQRPDVPTVHQPAWARIAIDAFIAAKYAEQGLSSVAEAEPHVLLRRVYLDLIGLPPTREQQQAFLANPTDDAYRAVVDELLSSPRYSERWARHWMDVWRYSDWAGYQAEIRESQYHIWRWRDWIIESLNNDKAYDQMIVEMLAGDELAPTDPNVLRATGYLGRSWFKFNRHVWLDNTIEHSSKAFLGLTLNCARCHEHKYDPIEQADYYRFRAFFEPHDVRYDPVSAETDFVKAGLPRVYDKESSAQTVLFRRGNEQLPDKDHPLSFGLPEFFGAELNALEVQLPVEAYYPALREEIVDATLKEARQTVAQAEQAVNDSPAPDVLIAWKLTAAQRRLTALESRVNAERAKYGLDANTDVAALTTAAITAEVAANVSAAEADVLAAEQALSQTQDDKKAGAEAEKKLAAAKEQLTKAQQAVTNPPQNYSPLGSVYPQTSTGRRLALARWIANRSNPLTARVAVNHIWLRHFGSPLVPTVFDFGNNGQPPTHPELLDWLAVEFMDNGWSMKHLHRLIVTSSVYRLASQASHTESGERTAESSAPNPQSLIPNPSLSDPDNRFLWRANVRRLEAEVVRDCVLHVGGALDLTMGGPELDENQGQTATRRSIYFRHAKEKRMTFLEVFDGPGVSECYRRDETIVPQQALALANSPIAKQQSRRLAGILSRESEDDATFIASLFSQVLCRPPSADEVVACREFLASTERLLSDPKHLTAAAVGVRAEVAAATDARLRARENLTHVLINHNDFVTLR